MNTQQRSIPDIPDDTAGVYPAEHRLLLKCCQQFIYKNVQKDIEKFVNEQEINWDELWQLAIQHGVLPVFHVLIFHRIKAIPSDFFQRIRQYQQQTIRRNRSLTQELIRVEKAFREQGLAAVPYKGLAFARQFYHNIIQRSLVDIDFALDLEKFPQAKQIMEDFGYEELKGGLHTDLEKSRAYYLDYPFVLKKDGRIVFNIEFHWTPSHEILNIPIRFSEFSDQLSEIKIGRQPVLTFNIVPQALFAIIHHGNVDCWGKLKHLVDLAFILSELDEAEQEELEMLCKKYKVYKSLQRGKALLGKLFQDPEYNHLKVSSRWMKDIVTARLKGNWSENKYKFVYFINSRDSFWEKIKATYSLVKYQYVIKRRL